MAAHRRDPLAVVTRDQREASDRALTTFVIVVQQVNGDDSTLVDRVTDGTEHGIIPIADGALPEPAIAGRDVEIAREAAELLELTR